MSPAYLSGFGNEFESEAKPGALPVGQNNPQKCPYGLYAEQISGSAFTAPGAHNFRIWTYRMRPSVRHMPRFESIRYPEWVSAGVGERTEPPLGQFRWGPIKIPDAPTMFPAGIATMTTAGDVQARDGLAVHVYAFNQSMTDDYFLNADGEMLIVPELGRLRIHTELGILDVEPLEICVIPRGLVFRVESLDGPSRGYISENYGRLFALPERGPIGANGLANPRDFKYPVASYEEKETPCRIEIKWCGRFFRTEIEHSPLDVVAWHGNYAPYKYDLRLFCPVGAILFDHPDPSIFTVLTAASGEPGTANIDFVIFPPRWMVAEDTFRPPWFHRNIMSEFMGLILGKYDAKEEGFRPGGMSLHNMMLPHGPDRDGFEKATNADLAPEKLEETMAFMFESRLPQQMTSFAVGLETRDEDYADCWSGLERKFDRSGKDL